MPSDEDYGLTDEEKEIGSWGESIEDAVVEIRNMLPFLESASSGVEFADSKSSAIFPVSFLGQLRSISVRLF